VKGGRPRHRQETSWGSVLACNNYEVIDMGRHGVVREDPRTRQARGKRRDLIGLSGADHAVARRDGPTWRARWSAKASSFRFSSAARRRAARNTAIKIAPFYSEPVVHVLDASRAVPVTTTLLSQEKKAALRRSASRRL